MNKPLFSIEFRAPIDNQLQVNPDKIKIKTLSVMIYLDIDYNSGAHPQILAALVKTNNECNPGYGYDPFSQQAKELIREACGKPESEVYFFVGGTQTNMTVISALLRSFQGVLAADSAHINVHEAGAIEAAGHKVLALPQYNGKISVEDLKSYLVNFYADDTWQHMVSPGMLYITHPTEYGTMYTLEELKQIRQICDEYNLPLYLDGARLGYALYSPETDVTLKDIARLCDAFYIGGTKEGLLLGEAVVARKGLLPNFFSIMKQRGAVLAKGRVLGVQFLTLFKEGLLKKICSHAVRMALMIREGFRERGFTPMIESPTNQQFFVLPNKIIDELEKIARFEYWGPRGEKESAVRFVTTYRVKEEDVKLLLDTLSEIVSKES